MRFGDTYNSSCRQSVIYGGANLTKTSYQTSTFQIQGEDDPDFDHRAQPVFFRQYDDIKTPPSTVPHYKSLPFRVLNLEVFTSSHLPSIQESNNTKNMFARSPLLLQSLKAPARTTFQVYSLDKHPQI
jgi:hypothetical protein